MSDDDDSEEGQRRKREGMARALAAAAAAAWRADAQIVLRNLALAGEPFTSETIIEQIGLPSGQVGQHRNNAMGGLLSGAARRGQIRAVGWTYARRATSHAEKLTLWKGTGHAQQSTAAR